jgi:hypothetical protein
MIRRLAVELEGGIAYWARRLLVFSDGTPQAPKLSIVA